MANIENPIMFISSAWTNEECAGLIGFLNGGLLYHVHIKQNPY
jgi:hypothetical protein